MAYHQPLNLPDHDNTQQPDFSSLQRNGSHHQAANDYHDYNKAGYQLHPNTRTVSPTLRSQEPPKAPRNFAQPQAQQPHTNAVGQPLRNSQIPTRPGPFPQSSVSKPGSKTSLSRKKMAQAASTKPHRTRRFYPPTIHRDPINMLQIPNEMQYALQAWVRLIPHFQGLEKEHGQPMAMTHVRVGALWMIHSAFLDDIQGRPPNHKERDAVAELGLGMASLRVKLASEPDDDKGDYLITWLEETMVKIEASLTNAR